MRIDVRVYGEPKAQPRPRGFRKGNAVRVFDPGTAEGWKSLVAAALLPHLPDTPEEGPVALTARFLMPRPKRLLRANDPAGELAHTSKPDADNLIKAIMDACSQINVWRDDTQVIDLFVQKRYASKDGRPGLHLIIQSIQEGL